MSKISLVVPVYNEEDNVEIFYKNFLEASEKVQRLKKSEVIYIDDGSLDQTANLVKKISKKDDRVKLVSLTRNLGVNTAFSAGLDYATGDCMIFIDVDGQYPMSVLNGLLKIWDDNKKIVFVRRLNYQPSFLVKSFTYLFMGFINAFSYIKLDRDTSYVCLLDRDVIRVLKTLEETTRYYPGLIRWTGFEIGYVECKINKRAVGNSKIGIRKKISEAISALTDFTPMLLRASTVFGFIISTISVLYGFVILLMVLKNGIDVPGYTSLILAILFIGGLQLMSIGILSEYISKIYSESKRRPSYIVKETVGLEKIFKKTKL